jgi:hypothetical protein
MKTIVKEVPVTETGLIISHVAKNPARATEVGHR